MISRARASDIDTIIEGNVGLAHETEDLALDVDRVRAGVQAVLTDAQRGHYYVGEVQGAAVAQMMITFEWSDWRNGVVWWIQSVYVWPGFRRQGHFEALYKSAQADAQAAGAVGMRLYVDTTNTRAQAVYERVGMNGDHYRVFESMV